MYMQEAESSTVHPVFVLQYFSSDDPDLYTTKVQYIEENDVTDLGLVFAEEEFEHEGTPTVSFIDGTGLSTC